jgi:hypothetical protein
MSVEHPVEAALGTYIEPPVCQHRHDLPWRQRREFRLVAGEQDPLAFLACEAMGHMALAALAAVHTVHITGELPAPALQRGEANAQQGGHFSGPSTGCHGGIKNLQGLAAILGGGQSSPSSPQ